MRVTVEIQRVVKQKIVEAAVLFKEMVGLNPLLLLYYLGEEQKEQLRTAYPGIDFKRAPVALVNVRGEEKASVFRDFLKSHVELNMPWGLGKTIKIVYLENEWNGQTDFWVIFVNQVFEGELTWKNISYLSNEEINEWENQAGNYLRHYGGGVTVIKD